MLIESFLNTVTDEVIELTLEHATEETEEHHEQVG